MDHIGDASANTIDFEIKADNSTTLTNSSKKHISYEGDYTNSGLHPSSCISDDEANEGFNHAISETDSNQYVQNIVKQEQFNVCSKKQLLTDVSVITDIEQENLSQLKKPTSDEPQWKEVTKEVLTSKTDRQIIKFSIDELKQIKLDIESTVAKKNLISETFNLATKDNNDKVGSNSMSNKLKQICPYHSDTSLESQYSTVNILNEVHRTNLNITKSSSFPYFPNSISQGHINFVNENTIVSSSERPTKTTAKCRKHITIRYDDSDEEKEDKNIVQYCSQCLQEPVIVTKTAKDT